MANRRALNETLSRRNREALRLLHEAAAALSDDELDHARRLQRHAARRLSPIWGGRLAVLEQWADVLRRAAP